MLLSPQSQSPGSVPSRDIPAATVARLPIYHRVLGQLLDDDVATVSSAELAELTGVNSAKVRKDLSHLGSYGVRGVGYDVARLAEEITDVRRMELMRVSRAEQGCIEYTFAADPLDPGRVVLFEKWETQEDLDAHLAAIPAPAADAAPQVVPASSSIVIYDVTGERPLRR